MRHPIRHLQGGTASGIYPSLSDSKDFLFTCVVGRIENSIGLKCGEMAVL